MDNALALIHIMEAINENEETKRFELFCSKLPPEDAHTARKDRAAKKEKGREIREQHRRNIEVAKAGKAEVTVNNYLY